MGTLLIILLGLYVWNKLMAKLTLNTIGSRYGSIDALNDNSDLVEAALENTLSRDGTGPNNMESDLDMDSHRIINLNSGVHPQDAVTKNQLDTNKAEVNALVQSLSTSPYGDAANVSYIPAGVSAVPTTVQTKLRESVSIEDFGGGYTKSEAVNDAAFAAAFAVSNRVVVPAAVSAWLPISTAIVIPGNAVLDAKGARIVSSATEIIRFGGSGTILGHGAFFRSSNNTPTFVAGIALASPMPVNAGPKIYGFPNLSKDDPTLDPSVGVDMTGWYGGYLEIRVQTYKRSIYASSTATQPTYYNEIHKPWLRTGSAPGATAIYLEQGGSYTNAMTIVSPFISGNGTARYGIVVDGAASVNILGGYVEAFAPTDAAARGIFIQNAGSINVHGVDFDSGSDGSNRAIGIYGTCSNLNFYGCTFSAGWASSNLMLDNPSANTFSMYGDSRQDRTLIGQTFTTMPITGVLQGSSYVNTQYMKGNLIPGIRGNSVDFAIASGGTGFTGAVQNNLFDKYEEGTWTPANPSISFASASGVYTKIGNMVFAYCTLTFPTTADGGAATITGLPYPVNAIAGDNANFGGFVGFTNAGIAVAAFCTSSTQSATLYNAATSVNLTNAGLSAKVVRLQLVYRCISV